MILRNCEACQKTESTQSFGPCVDCSCDCHKKPTMNDDLIKRPVTHDADACFDADDLVICFAETDNSVCPTDRRITRAIDCLEEITVALNEYPDQAARISELEAKNKVLTEALELAVENIPQFAIEGVFRNATLTSLRAALKEER